MSAKQRQIRIASRYENDKQFSSDISVFPPDDDGRITLAVYTGCSTAHLYMTPEEAQALVDALRSFLAKESA